MKTLIALLLATILVIFLLLGSNRPPAFSAKAARSSLAETTNWVDAIQTNDKVVTHQSPPK